MRWLGAALLLLGTALGPARAQTMLDQERRLIDIHSLLVALPPLAPPGAYREGEASLGLEIVGIPSIDGTTGGRRQITASDQTRAFPRPRLALGLPAPEGFRAFAGLAYIPPVAVREVSSHLGAVEAGIAWVPGRLAVGVRGSAVVARSRSPVTDPDTRDTLRTIAGELDLSAGWRLGLGPVEAMPYAGLGLVRVAGDFHVTSDGADLSSRTTRAALSGGVRLWLARPGIEAVAEVVAYPGRLVHPGFRIGWVPRWGGP